MSERKDTIIDDEPYRTYAFPHLNFDHINYIMGGIDTRLSMLDRSIANRIDALRNEIGLLHDNINRLTKENRQLKNNQYEIMEQLDNIKRKNNFRKDKIPVFESKLYDKKDDKIPDKDDKTGVIIQFEKEKQERSNLSSFLQMLTILSANKAESKAEKKVEEDIESIDTTEYDEMDIEIVTLRDMIDLGKKIKNSDENKDIKRGTMLDGKHYNIDRNKIINLIEPLERLDDMIGLTDIKTSVMEMIFYCLQNLDKKKGMTNCIIDGPPGTGKTEFGKVLSEIYAAMGIVPENKFIFASANDFIGQFVGFTEEKTEKMLEKARGGVLFIDEAYSLGGNGGRMGVDSFRRAFVDTLVKKLTDMRGEVAVILAGYGEEMRDDLMSMNKGLKRRFPFSFTINGYNAHELKGIFMNMLDKSNWSICEELLSDDDERLIDFFRVNIDRFPYFGGDMETLLMSCKFCHAKRTFGKNPALKKNITYTDIENGFKRFLRKCEEKKGPPPGMYN